MKIRSVFLGLAALLAASSFVFGQAVTEQLTLTTYYPSPVGSYSELQLVPKAEVAGDCAGANDEGKMFYDAASHSMRVCKNVGGGVGWGDFESWTVSDDNTQLFAADIDWNVGIGTRTPRTRLELANDGAILASGSFGDGWIEPNLGAGTRLLWYPLKGAFRVGRALGTEWDNANIGIYSIAMGREVTASGGYSIAMGRLTTASGNYSTAMGIYTSAIGDGATAIGNTTTANGNYSTAMGRDTIASGNYSTAIGYQTTASGDYSIAMGRDTTANGINSTSNGYKTTASGDYSSAMGRETIASGDYSTAMGIYTSANGPASVAMGNGTTVIGKNSVVMGLVSTASGDNSFAGGVRANARNPGCFVWADSKNAAYPSNGADQFRVRANGGAFLEGAEWADVAEFMDVLKEDGIKEAEIVSIAGDDRL
ncbi:MAG: hypothetical protein ABIH18_00930, partial [Candidatus Omnitrophota bacterium]